MSDINLAKMSDSDIEEKIINITSELFNKKPAEITLDTNFIEDLAADSLDTVEFTLAVEEAFNIEIPDSEAGKVATVNDIVKYVIAEKNKASSNAGTATKHPESE
jgi:acyl carrier protein